MDTLMDSEQSLSNVLDFERRIARMHGSTDDEQFVRSFLSDIVLDCPMHVLQQVASCVLDIRKTELRIAGEEN
jgi:hypothetical protein